MASVKVIVTNPSMFWDYIRPKATPIIDNTTYKSHLAGEYELVADLGPEYLIGGDDLRC